MKKILIVASLLLPLGLTQAEEIKVYPQGISESEMKSHKRGRSKAGHWSTKPKPHRIKNIDKDVKCNSDSQKIKKHKRKPSKKGIRTTRIKF